MSIDLTKLAPAPWHVRQSESHRDKWILADANNEYIATFEIKEVAERCALGHNALDVMVRRGWGVVQIAGLWLPGLPSMALLEPLREKRWTCPFTALVEADKWMKENVEAKT